MTHPVVASVRNIESGEDLAYFPASTARDADAQRPFLAADIGGTHARLGLVAPQLEGAPRVLSYRSYRCADHPHLDGIVRQFCAELDARPRELVLASAGYLHAGVVVNRNLAWPLVPATLAQELRLERVRFLNDFEALAHAIAYVDEHSSVALKTAFAPDAQQGPIAVIGPGTGLGAAVWFPGEPPRVIATEAGQIQLAARGGLEREVLDRIAAPDCHTPYEAVLSGPGLHRLYAALCAVYDRYPSCAEPADVVAAAEAGDEVAYETLQMFGGWMGSFAGDLAMLYGTTGGVYLAGGFLSRIVDLLRCGPLVERFLDKGVMRPFLHKVPIRVVDHGQLGVVGAASWHLHTRTAKQAPG
nr:MULTISPECIES: glucokinase [unclassified Dyella]